MKIIVNNQQANSIIDTGDANITEVFDMFIGSLIQEGFHVQSIYKELESRREEFELLKEKHNEQKI